MSMGESFFIIPTVLGWLMFFSAILQYFYFLKYRGFSKKYKWIFAVTLILWIISLIVWAYFRNL